MSQRSLFRGAELDNLSQTWKHLEWGASDRRAAAAGGPGRAVGGGGQPGRTAHPGS